MKITRKQGSGHLPDKLFLLSYFFPKLLFLEANRLHAKDAEAIASSEGGGGDYPVRRIQSAGLSQQLEIKLPPSCTIPIQLVDDDYKSAKGIHVPFSRRTITDFVNLLMYQDKESAFEQEKCTMLRLGLEQADYKKAFNSLCVTRMDYSRYPCYKNIIALIASVGAGTVLFLMNLAQKPSFNSEQKGGVGLLGDFLTEIDSMWNDFDVSIADKYAIHGDVSPGIVWIAAEQLCARTYSSELRSALLKSDFIPFLTHLWNPIYPNPKSHPNYTIFYHKACNPDLTKAPPGRPAVIRETDPIDIEVKITKEQPTVITPTPVLKSIESNPSTDSSLSNLNNLLEQTTRKAARTTTTTHQTP